jgi:hypothetical protein
VQTVAPFGLFAAQPISAIAGCFIVVHQLILIVSGNYSWLNWLTVVLGFTAFSDGVLEPLFGLRAPPLVAEPAPFTIALYLLGALTLILGVQPVLNLFSKNQHMNFSYNPIHLVGSYGAFGSITKQRHEIVVEGTDIDEPSSDADFREYEFKGKPGNVNRRPRQWAPYHLRLDWLMWFLPMSVLVVRDRVLPLGNERWFVRFVTKLLEADRATLGLLARDPFDGKPPKFVRASFYRYEFTTPRERRLTGQVWKRTYIGEYLPPVALAGSTEPRVTPNVRTAEAPHEGDERRDGGGVGEHARG